MNYVSVLESFISLMIAEGASDLHLASGRVPSIRVSGELVLLRGKPQLSHEDMKGILAVLLGPEKALAFEEKKEADFAYSSGTSRLRCNAFIQRGNLVIIFRLIPQVKTLQELSLPPILETFALKKQGFFLVAGPVGHGKSTTLAAMIEVINQKKAAHIVTIEDPIEYLFEPKVALINQREVGVDTDSFATALKAAFREDVNVLLVGEMRDPHTMATAVTAAETGHLVLATIHTNTAAQTVNRIIDSFQPEQQDQIRMQLAASLLGIFSQRLIPSLGGGRVPAYELMINTPATATMIREKRTHELDVVIETSTEQGMISMNRSLVALVQEGKISIDDAIAFSPNPRSLTI